MTRLRRCSDLDGFLEQLRRLTKLALRDQAPREIVHRRKRGDLVRTQNPRVRFVRLAVQLLRLCPLALCVKNKGEIIQVSQIIPVVGGKVLWRHPVLGQPVGSQPLHEVLAAWYPTHQAFLDLPTAPGAEENFRLRRLAVENAVIHRFAGDVYPLSPPGDE